MSHTLEKEIASLKQEIADYRAAWINATSEERRSSLEKLIMSRSEILARLLDENKNAKREGKFNKKKLTLYSLWNNSLSCSSSSESCSYLYRSYFRAW
jgi:hypothetical protein